MDEWRMLLIGFAIIQALFTLYLASGIWLVLKHLQRIEERMDRLL